MRRRRLVASEAAEVERKVARVERREGVEPRAAEVLKLQRAGGNVAVAGLLQRQDDDQDDGSGGATAAPPQQADQAGAAADVAPGETQDPGQAQDDPLAAGIPTSLDAGTAGPMTCTLGSDSFAIDSFNFGTPANNGRIDFLVQDPGILARLQLAAFQKQTFALMTIALKAVTLKLTSVTITGIGFQKGGSTQLGVVPAHFEFTFASIAKA
jgi:hypothetical protein